MGFWKERRTPAQIAQEERTEELVGLAYTKPAEALGSLSKAIVSTEGNAVYLRSWHKHEVVMAAVSAYIRKKHFSTALRELARHAGSVNQDAKSIVTVKVRSCVEGFNDASLSYAMQLAVKDLGRFLSRSEQSEFCIRIQTRARIMATADKKKSPKKGKRNRPLQRF